MIASVSIVVSLTILVMGAFISLARDVIKAAKQNRCDI